MRTAVICSAGSTFNRRVLPAYLASISELAGIVVIRETPRQRWRRLRSEWRRSRWRILDVAAFRLYYRLRLAATDRAWIKQRAADELSHLGTPPEVPVHETDDPNSEETRDFLTRMRPEIAVAACKTLLRPEIFSIADRGTFVVHPGICPEYRNSHGCFWALAQRDLDRVGATLLRIDQGVDTGPVFAYYSSDFDERSQSHVVIQHRVVYDNLEQIGHDLHRIYEGTVRPLDTSGRSSTAWGQPRLTDYLRWKRAARLAA